MIAKELASVSCYSAAAPGLIADMEHQQKQKQKQKQATLGGSSIRNLRLMMVAAILMMRKEAAAAAVASAEAANVTDSLSSSH